MIVPRREPHTQNLVQPRLRSLVIVAVCAAAMVSAGCSSAGTGLLARPVTITPAPARDLADVGGDQYSSAVPEFAGVDVDVTVPTPVPNASTSSGPTATDGVGGLLQAQDQQIDCLSVGQLVVEYSAVSSAQDGSASIDTILDTRLLDDWSATATVPPPGEKTPVVRCWARVRWSVGAESDVDLWLLVDSNGNARVRWDNIAKVDEHPGDGTA